MLLKFLRKLLWKCQIGKHQTMIEYMYSGFKDFPLFTADCLSERVNPYEGQAYHNKNCLDTERLNKQNKTKKKTNKQNPSNYKPITCLPII